MLEWTNKAVKANSIQKNYIIKKVILSQMQIDLILSQKILKLLSKSSNLEFLKESVFNKVDLKAFSRLFKLIKDHLTELLKEALFNIVLLLKTTDSINLASSNAITLLNRSGFSFNYKDLSKIKIPNADLSYGLFCNTNFESSNIHGVQFSMANIYSSNFRNCNMNEMDFGVKHLVNGFKENAWLVKLSLCGRFLAVAEDRKVFLYDAKTYQEITQLISHLSKVFYFTFSDNGNYLISLSPDRMIIWDTSSKLKIDQFMQNIYFSSFSPCIKYICIVTNVLNIQSNSNVKIYDIDSRKIVNEIEVEFPNCSYLAFFSPSGKNILILSCDFLTLWNLNSKAKINQNAHRFYHRSYSDAISSNRKYIAVPLCKSEIIIYSTETLEVLIKFRKSYFRESLISFSPCGRYIVSAYLEKSIEVFDLILKDKIFEVSRSKLLNSKLIIFSQNGKNLINISSKILKSQKIHFAEANSKVITRKGIKMVSFSENNEYYAAACEEGQVFIFLTKNQTLIKNFQAHAWKIYCISWSKTILATLGSDYVIKIWDIPDGVLLKSLKLNDKFEGIQFSPDGKKIIMYGIFRNFVEIWDIEKNEIIASWVAHMFGVAMSHWSQCGNFVVTCGYTESSIKIWRTDSYNLFTEHAINIRFYKYLLPISNLLAFFSQNHNLEVQCSKDLKDYNIEYMVANNNKERSINLILFSPYRQIFIVGYKTGHIKVWDYNQKVSWIINAHKEFAQSISISPNGNFIISSSKDKTVKLWKLDEWIINLRQEAINI